MRITILITALSMLVYSTQTAFSANVSGTVYGQWTVSDSPVTVEGNIVISSGTTLTIDPGVSVLFEGPYSITVSGELVAVGTKAQPILFSRATSTAGSRWQGIRFEGSDDSSKLEYCIIEHTYRKDTNGLNVRGGAIRIYNSSPIITNSIIRYNTAINDNWNGTGGAILIEGNSTSLIEDNLLSQNESDSGGAVAVGNGSRPVIRRNQIINNVANYSGGGIYLGAGANAEIDSNIIRDNSSHFWGGGGVALWNSRCDDTTPCTKVYNNVVINNSAQRVNAPGAANGGGFYCRYNASSQFNNTIVGNSADGNGGGLYVLNSGLKFPAISNSIIRENSATAGAQITLDGDGSQLTVEYSNVEGSWSGVGNIDDEPDFVNMAAGVLRYMPGSAGIEAGNNNLADLPAYDIAGHSRTIDGDASGTAMVDMGAYEFDPAASLPTDCNNDQQITLADTIAILQLVTGRTDVISGEVKDIDVDNDGMIGISEALYSLQYLKN